MNRLTENKLLGIALLLSLLVHGVLLMVRFAAPDLPRPKPVEQGLEVILVNAKHDRKPVKAEALAQANLDGGGNADAGRAKSPLPDSGRIENGTDVAALQRQIAELETRQREIMSKMQQSALTTKQKTAHAAAEHMAQMPMSQEQMLRTMARMEAEVAKNIEAYNKRPKKTHITPSTREVGYAQYYKKLQEKIERIGTQYFPEKEGRKLYGEMLVSIPVFQDGTIYKKEGGVRIERSSGNPALDAAAIAIVQRALPFDALPAHMRTKGHDDVWEIITRFHFMRDETLRADLQSN